MPSCLASHRICELYRAIFFSIMYSICQQCLYIHLLFLCISHLSRSWQNLEWKQGLLSSQCYLSMQISCWLQIAPQRRIQREMTSRNPHPPEVHALTWLGYIAHIMHMVSCIAMPSTYIRHVLCECLLFAFYIRYVNYAMPCFSASYHICELCTAMEPGIIYVNYLMPSFFFITYSICWQSVYIELLFMCISHLSRLWKNLDWKQGLQSRQWYLLKHISRWLQGPPQRRIQRQMTSPISHPRCML